MSLLHGKKLTKEKQINSNLQIASSRLWYNENLSVKAMFFPKLYSKGIIMITDVIDNEGKVLTSQKLKGHYNLDLINFLDYLHISTVVRKFINEHKHGEFNKIIGPIMPLNYWILKNNDTNGFYKILLAKHPNDHVARGKWENELNVAINNQMWKRIFQLCHWSIKDNTYVWLQLRIFYRILGTRSYLSKVNLREDASCFRCRNEMENIIHMLVLCPKVKEFWNLVQEYIKSKVTITLLVTPFNIILGYTLAKVNQQPINTILLVAKTYL